jgi:2-dehydro-3-deoxyphosphogluconate aldolase / (4S)-4-hydroxy-2-oxoglutarate aldolase
VLCVRLGDAETALAAAEAAVRGGLRCIEIAMTTPDAAGVMLALADRCPHATVGAGTVLTVADAAAAAAAGARFALSPVTDAAVVRWCAEAGVLAVPGAATPTEVWAAAGGAGAALVKVWPVRAAGGLRLVRSLGGPLGGVRLLPSGGIAAGAAAAYLRERNVWAVGASAQVLEPGAVGRRDWDAVAANARVWAGIAAAAVAARADADRGRPRRLVSRRAAT